MPGCQGPTCHGKAAEIERKMGNCKCTVCPTRYRTRHFFNNLYIVATIMRTTDTHYKHIPLHFSHNERTPVQISLQYLH
jgi:hypothetical protein